MTELDMEWNKWTDVTSTWSRVSLQKSWMATPRVIITGAYTYSSTSGEYSIEAEIKDIDTTGASVRFIIPPHDAQSGWSNPSTISIFYIAAKDTGDSSDYVIPGTSLKVQVGQFSDTNVDDNNSWTATGNVSYNPSFSGGIAVFHNRTSHNSASWATTWCCRKGSRTSPPNSSDDSCAIYHQIAEVSPTFDFNSAETIDYMIVETGTATITRSDDSSATIQVTSGQDSGSPGIGNTTSFNVSGELSGFGDSPDICVMDQQEMDGNNGGWGLLKGSESWNSTTIYGWSIEDQDQDTERNHTSEYFSCFAFSDAGYYSSQQDHSESLSDDISFNSETPTRRLKVNLKHKSAGNESSGDNYNIPKDLEVGLKG